MIGYVSSPSNDVYLYFEKGDIASLDAGVVRGDFFNSDLTRFVDLGVFVGKQGGDLISTHVIQDEDVITGQMILIKPDIYEDFKERGRIGDHQSWRHVNLLDVSRFRGMEEGNYRALVDARERLG